MAPQPSEQLMEGQLFGHSISFAYSETWVAYSVVSLRLLLGYVILSSGIDKVFDPEWSAEAFLNPATGFGVVEANPLSGFFAELSASAAYVDPLVIAGQILVGLALIFGVAFRFAAFWGAVMMLLFWLAGLQGGILAGLPVEHGYIVDSSMVYAVILFGLGALGAGRILGIDRYLEEMAFVQDRPWLKYLLG